MASIIPYGYPVRLFCDWKKLSNKDIQLINNCHRINTIVLGVPNKQRLKPVFNPSYNASVEAELAARRTRCRVEIMYWVHRNERYLEKMCSYIASSHCTDFTTISCGQFKNNFHPVLDIEPLSWRKGNLTQMKSTDLIVDRLGANSFDITIFPDKQPGLEELASKAYSTILQTYSAYTGKKWSQNRKTFPGILQLTGNKVWSKHARRLSLCIPAYGLPRPANGITPKIQAFEQRLWAIAQCIQLDRPIYIWSIKTLHKDLKLQEQLGANITR